MMDGLTARQAGRLGVLELQQDSAEDLKRFLERCGLSWGADLNAETGMERLSTHGV